MSEKLTPSPAYELSAAICPACRRRGVMEQVVRGVRRWMCRWCAHPWTPEAV